MTRAACTIVSLNYLPYARTLSQSFHAFHPDDAFYVLVVDRPPAEPSFGEQDFETVWVEDLAIPNFDAVAFKYGILELNTNVKPTFLKYLLSAGVKELIYFDPDILLCDTACPIFEELADHAIVLTPHALAPNDDNVHSEQLILGAGVFNLGFIAVADHPEARRFLDWWEDRCLTLAYDERWAGLFVDQKWINLVPCYFELVTILKHPGCNVAYWNLHERAIARSGDGWIVNQVAPLVFFHFSGISVDGGKRISKHTEQFDLESRPEFADLFADYRARLEANGIRSTSRDGYAYSRYSDGKLITKLQRAAFAANLDRFGSSNPFDASGSFYDWAKRRHLHSNTDSVGSFGRKAYQKQDRRIRIVNAALRLVLRIIGPDRYTVLMKYMEYASLLRNQRDIYEKHRA